MTTIAFIGLGIMGEPMAGHLVDAGHDVVGVNHGQAALDRLVERGGRAAGSVADAVAEAEIVITMVPDSPDVEAIALGDDGLYSLAKPGTLHVDCSSIRPDVARRLAEAGAEPRGAGRRRAGERRAGRRRRGEAVDHGRGAGRRRRARPPVLEAMGSTVVHVGPAGAGQTVKAANQLIVAGHLQLLAEAIVFLEAHGVDMAASIAVLGGGLAGSTVLDRKAEGMLARRFDPASGSTCTTRTSASSRPPPGRPGS
jgi:2-hydroxy-3-oxopropionate reductase